jgi:cytochrome c oxidase subunit 2
LTVPKAEESNVVEIVAEQFAWNVQYAGQDGQFGRRDPKFIDSGNVLGLDPEDPAGKDDIITINEVHVPLGKPTLLYLTSKDVIHSFFVPAFRVKTDAMPGMRIPLWFEPTRAGKYEIACSQLCGIGHSKMRGDVVVDTPEEFEAWLASQAKKS